MQPYLDEIRNCFLGHEKYRNVGEVIDLLMKHGVLTVSNVNTPQPPQLFYGSGGNVATT